MSDTYRINILAFLIGIMFFTQSRSALADEEVPAVAEVIDLIELIQNAEEFDGRVVTITGFYIQKEEAALLYPSREAFIDSDYRYVVWIGVDDQGLPKSMRKRCDECLVVISGVFRSEIIGILGLKGQVVKLTRFERTDNPVNGRRRHQPR